MGIIVMAATSKVGARPGRIIATPVATAHQARPPKPGLGRPARHRDGAEERAHARKRGQQPERPRVPTEGTLGQQGHEHGEVEREREHDRHGDQRPAQVVGPPHVPQACNQVTPIARAALLRVEFAGPHQRQRDQHRDVADRIDQETRRHAHRGDQQARDGRPERSAIPVNAALLRLTALRTCSSPTIST